MHRNKREREAPIMAGRRLSAFFHWSRTMVTKREVRAKSIPLMDDGMKSPAKHPAIVPRIQERWARVPIISCALTGSTPSG